MLINKYFLPDLYLDDIYGITPEFLKSKNIKATDNSTTTELQAEFFPASI